MDLLRIYQEEDLFPKEFAVFAEREYGLLFYNDNNKDSYDSNHALIFKDKISDVAKTLEDITAFYQGKGIQPMIYQSMTDDGYFESIRGELSAYGYHVYGEENRYMVLLDACNIVPDPRIEVQKAEKWDDSFRTDIFEAAGEPWEADVAKSALERDNTLFFVAYIKGRPVGMTRAHTKNGVCRVDYLLVATEHRKKGVGRAILQTFAKYCTENKIENCFLWPNGASAERIYYEAGFRSIVVKTAGRAYYAK